MNGLFGYDGLLSQLSRGIWRLLLLSCCYAVCSLPIFTVGAATSALYGAFLNDHLESGTFKNYFRDFRNNFPKATVLWLIMLAVGLVLAGNWYALSVWVFPLHKVLMVICVLATALYAITLAFLFPLQARFENSVKQTLKNAFIVGLSNPLKSLVMAAIPLIPVFLLAFDVDSFIKIAALWVVFGFSITAWINSALAKKSFARFGDVPEPLEEE